MRYFLFILLVVITACSVNSSLSHSSAVKQNPLLFSIGEDSIFADEFMYVYRKNNAKNDSAFTQSDVNDYLNLFENFKLKIHEARQRGMDTTVAYRNEMNTYIAQLKKPYLTETKITDSLINEAYDRFKTEVRASHILIKVPENSQDTIEAYRKISEIRNKALNNDDFGELATKYSQDPSAAINHGDLGYFSSLQMVYSFENAAYNTKVGEISPVIRTKFGYHILKVTDKRPANGKVKVAHIMLRTDGNDSVEVRNKIFDIYDQAVGGVDWNQLVSQYSEDINSKNTGGQLQAFGIGQMPYKFQEVAFSLKEPGQISDPVQTKYGWHIIKLIEREPVQEKEKLTSYIKERIQNDERADMGENALITRLKKEWSLIENKATLDYIRSVADSSLINPPWKRPVVESDKPLFTMGDTTVFVSSFFDVVEKTVNKSSVTPVDQMMKLYNDFLNNTLLKFEEAHLGEKYDDYRMLRREYREGILLFQLMEKEVWTKASSDTTGLRKYYSENIRNYQLANEISGTKINLKDLPGNNVYDTLSPVVFDQELFERLKKYAKEANATAKDYLVKNLHLAPLVKVRKGIVLHQDDDLIVVDEIINYEKPDLDEIRGRVIADYQNYLEKIWIEKLKSRYAINRNEKGITYVKDKLVR